MPDRARLGEAADEASDGGAGPRAAALGGREMAADDLLYLGQRRAEGLDVGFLKAGQELHEHEAAELGRLGLGKRRQRGEGLGFAVAVGALGVRVEDEDGAPVLREIGVGRGPAAAGPWRRGRRR